MNIVGVEIDIVVTDSLKALALYESIFEIEPVGVTNFPKGENEVVFTLYGVANAIFCDEFGYQWMIH